MSYTCTSDNSLVQWIAEPFITPSGANAFIISNIPNYLGTDSFGPIIVNVVDINPIVTTVVISTAVIQVPLNVTCISGNFSDTLRYYPFGA